jgi:hypothetical protein
MFDEILKITHWYNKDAKTLATALSEPAAMTPMPFTTFFGAVVQSGGSPAEIRKLWAFDRYMQSAADAFEKGELQGVMALLATMPVDLDAGTMQAIGGVVAAMTVNAGGRQATWTAEEVTEALAEAGYTWKDGEWLHTAPPEPEVEEDA